MGVKVKKSYSCGKCSEEFDDFQTLRKHMGKLHPKKYVCYECGSEWTRKFWLTRHMDQMHGANSVPCTIIGCKMRVAYNRLKRHMQEYHGKENSESASTTCTYKPDFKCPQCTKIYKTPLSLKKHISGAHQTPYVRSKMYACEVEGCGKLFKAPCLLEDHINMHNGDYKYECNHCEKKFFGRAQFGVHLKKYHKTTLREWNKLVETLS